MEKLDPIDEKIIEIAENAMLNEDVAKLRMLSKLFNVKAHFYEKVHEIDRPSNLK